MKKITYYTSALVRNFKASARETADQVYSLN